MLTDEQIGSLMGQFGEAMAQVEPDVAEALVRDTFGIDPEVYEWDQGEMMKAILKKIASLDEAGLNTLLAKMAVAGGKKACAVASALFIAQKVENDAWEEEAKEMERLRALDPPQRIPCWTPDGKMGTHVVPGYADTKKEPFEPPESI